MNNKPVDSEKQSYVFGPVPSRRLGRSLGVDLVPFKVCSYDCVYCQLGRTTQKTIRRKEWVPLDKVTQSIKDHLSGKPDYITLAGSGEPTLYSRISQLIDNIKAITDIPLAVLTNGSLLWLPDVRRDISRADLVIPSLDAGSEPVFQQVNRPCHEITFEKMLQGLIDFRREYKGQYWLEVFVLDGMNASDAQIRNLAECIKRISPDRVQVNTVTRPPAEKDALPVPKERLEELASRLADNAEVIAEQEHGRSQTTFAATQDDILELLRRRPCLLDDIATGLNLHRNEVLKYLDDLTSQNKIQTVTQNNRLYYTFKENPA